MSNVNTSTNTPVNTRDNNAVIAPAISAVKLDTTYHVETPEGVDLQAETVGIIARSLAYVIDISIRFSVILALSIVLLFMGMGGGANGLLLVAMFLMEWFYPVLFETFRNGQTPGKKMMGIMVVNDDLTPVGFGTSFIRNLLRAVDFLPSLYLFGLTSMVLTRNFQRLGDIAAGTLVIYKPSITVTPKLPNAQLVPVPAILNHDDKLAIIQFTLRHNTLSEARQNELADLLTELPETRGRNPLQWLRGVGLSLFG